MGLDAAVYRRLEELPFTADDLRFISVDQRTGEVNFDHAALSRTWRDSVRIAKRIGNIALVSFLKAELERFLGDSGAETVLISKVLYSGTHAGDIVPNEDLGPLKDEIALVRGIAADSLSPEMKAFLRNMEELIEASEQYGNPIVFV